MSFKQKNKTMKSFTIPVLLISFLGSCITPIHVNYIDPNYLNSDEFSTYEEITAYNQVVQESDTKNDSLDSSANYSTDDYYDYSFSSRIRRFHRPMYYGGYYSGIYTDYYWYNNDPFSCGTSIYFGYNWLSPFYSYYSYSPYYFDYYSPYYFGNYYSYHGYKHNNTYYNNSIDRSSYFTGKRGMLSSQNKARRINSNTTKKTSTLNIRSNNTNKSRDFQSNVNITKYNKVNTRKNYNEDRNSSNVKNNNISNLKTTNKTRTKTNSNSGRNSYSNARGINSYSNPKTNNRRYNSRSNNYRSNINKSSRKGNRSIKPRR